MVAALVVVDVQNDFCPGGSLAVPYGEQIVAVLNTYIIRFRAAGLPVFASRDWHPARTTHFRDFGGQWPVHCVAGQPGAEFHAGLRLPPEVAIVSKGMGEAEDAYSAFEARDENGTPLAELLRRAEVDCVFVGGLATDYCVKMTVLDALGLGLGAELLIDAVRGVNVEPGDAEKAIAKMVDQGSGIVTTKRLRLRD